MQTQQFQVLFTHQQPWVNTYDYKRVSVSKPEFHYFTGEQQGFIKVNLLIKEQQDICAMDMYYQQVDNFDKLAISQRREDNSGLADLSDLQPPVPRAHVINTNFSRTSLWVEKYSPATYNDLLTDEYLNRTVMTWVKSWDPIVFKKKKGMYRPSVKNFPVFSSNGSNLQSNHNKFAHHQNVNPNQNGVTETQQAEAQINRLILMAGPPGCGKTTLARVVAKKCGYNYLEINASDNRSAKTLIARLQEMTNNESVTANHKPTLIILDEVDGVLESESNGMKEILNYIETGEIPGESRKHRANKKFNKEQGMYIKRPILFICNDPYTKGLRELRVKARILHFGKIKTDKLYETLRNISTKEKLGLTNEDLVKICELNQNDIRSSVSMMEYIAQNKGGDVAPKDILAQIVWDKKQSTKTLVEFLEQILGKKEKIRNIQYRKVLDKLFSVDVAPNLILEGFFGNYRNCKSIYHNSQTVPKLLDTICQSDVIITNSFSNNFEMNSFLPIPYICFKLFFKGEQFNKIEYPFAFFDRLTRQKANRQTVFRLLSGVNANNRPFMSFKNMLLDYGPALYACIQPPSQQEKDLINCIKLMVNYGITFSDNTQSNYNPELDKLFTGLQQKQSLNLVTNATRLTMSSHYKSVKENMAYEHQQTVIKRTINIQERRARKSEDGIHYRFLQGTGTEIEYAITMQYFI